MTEQRLILMVVLLLIANAIVAFGIARNICSAPDKPTYTKIDALGWEPKPHWI